MKGTVQVREDLTEIANDNFSVTSPSRSTATVLGDGDRIYHFVLLDDRASLRQCRCIQKPNGSVCEGGDEFAIGGQSEGVAVTGHLQFRELGPGGHVE